MSPRAPGSLQLLSDDPIRDRERDGLDLASWAEVVASAALGATGPLAIGVFGRWGMGKTSVLHLAKAMIDGSPQAGDGQITTVMFNAWQYEREANPLVPLIASILGELEGRRRRQRRGPSELYTALRSALYGLSAKVSGGVPFLGEVELSFDADKSVDRFEALRSQARWIDQQIERTLYLNAFQALREAQGTGGGEKAHRIVILIDDLDRCLPTSALRLLESIKLVLSEPGFVFVLAVDRSVLAGFLEKRFSEAYGLRGEQWGHAYLAKFIQVPLTIPPHKPRFADLIKRILGGNELADCSADLLPLVEEIGLACGHNPRQLVRFLNDLLVDRFIYRVGDRGEFPLRLFIIARGIRFLSEFVYDGLLELEDFCEEIRKCDGRLEAVRETVSRRLAEASPRDLYFETLRRIEPHGDLTSLLASEPAKEWLESASNRRNVEYFLAIERNLQKSGEFQEWTRKMTERALAQIQSEDREEIVAGCHLLAVYDSPLRNQALSRLRELSGSADEHVAEQAMRTLSAIGAGSLAERRT